MPLYLLFALFVFVLSVIAIKLHDGEVTTGDIVASVFIGLIPVLNVCMIFFALVTLLGSKGFQRMMSKKLF